MREILFVCTGNICRSAMAEGYLKYLLEGTSQAATMRIRSAGTHAHNGNSPPVEAVSVCAQEGFDISRHQAQILTRELVERADLICLAERLHKNFVLVLSAKASTKIHLMSEWSTSRNRNKDVPDPYLKAVDVYQDTLERIVEAVDGLYETLFPHKN